MDWPGLATYRFGPFGDVEAYQTPGADPGAIHDSFIRGVLPEVLVAREHEALHGSAVAIGDRVIAFCARSGVGKSSLGLGLAARPGAAHWADDSVLICGDSGSTESHVLCLPFPARVDQAAREALQLDPACIAQSRPGTIGNLARIYVMAREASLPPERPVIEDLAPTELFEHVLAHAHPFELGGTDRRRRMLERLMSVASAVRGCRIRFSPSLAELPRLVDVVAQHIESA
jgi:hypothetical protein